MYRPLNVNVAYFLLHTSCKRSFPFSAQLRISKNEPIIFVISTRILSDWLYVSAQLPLGGL